MSLEYLVADIRTFNIKRDIVGTQPHLAALLQFMEIVNPVLCFRAACLRLAAHPVKLGAQQIFHLGQFGRQSFLAFLAFGKIVVIITLVSEYLLPVYLYDFIADTVKEITVMGDHQQSHSLSREPRLKTLNHVYVQMVGRLVKQQKLWFGEQYSSQGNALQLASGQLAHGLSHVGYPQ